MKYLERLGSVAFATILLSNVFHLLGMSYKSWIIIDCKTCLNNDSFKQITISLHERCYQSSVARIFAYPNQTFDSGTFRAGLCMPNKIMFARERKYANYCFEIAFSNPDVVCTSEIYNKDYCGCDYTTRTKVALGTTIITSIALGVMVFFGHLISFVKIDYVLNWLIPLCFGLLVTALICITIALSVIGALVQEDIWEFFYLWSLYEKTTTDLQAIQAYELRVKEDIDKNYNITIGWSAGLEIVALYFALVSLILYALMFVAKQKPEGKHRSKQKQKIELSEINRKY